MTARNDDGFTLVELLIAVMLLGVVTAAVAGGLLLLFRTTEETTQRMSESPGLQIAAAYFGSDVQSAQTFGGPACGPGGGSPLLTVSWTDGNAVAASTDDRTIAVSYVVDTVGTQKQLVRHSCVGAAPADSSVLVAFLSPETSPTVACTPSCAAPRAQASVVLQVCTASLSAATCDSDPYEFTLTGTRRT